MEPGALIRQQNTGFLNLFSLGPILQNLLAEATQLFDQPGFGFIRPVQISRSVFGDFQQSFHPLAQLGMDLQTAFQACGRI